MTESAQYPTGPMTPDPAAGGRCETCHGVHADASRSRFGPARYEGRRCHLCSDLIDPAASVDITADTCSACVRRARGSAPATVALHAS